MRASSILMRNKAPVRMERAYVVAWYILLDRSVQSRSNNSTLGTCNPDAIISQGTPQPGVPKPPRQTAKLSMQRPSISGPVTVFTGILVLCTWNLSMSVEYQCTDSGRATKEGLFPDYHGSDKKRISGTGTYMYPV